jgi:hypothetical protein
MIAVSDVICSCGAELHLSGDWIYVSRDTCRFYNLHKGEGHWPRPDLAPGDKRGRDNGRPWWEYPR